MRSSSVPDLEVLANVATHLLASVTTLEDDRNLTGLCRTSESSSVNNMNFDCPCPILIVSALCPKRPWETNLVDLGHLERARS